MQFNGTPWLFLTFGSQKYEKKKSAKNPPYLAINVKIFATQGLPPILPRGGRFGPPSYFPHFSAKIGEIGQRGAKWTILAGFGEKIDFHPFLGSLPRGGPYRPPPPGRIRISPTPEIFRNSKVTKKGSKSIFSPNLAKMVHLAPPLSNFTDFGRKMGKIWGGAQIGPPRAECQKKKPGQNRVNTKNVKAIR